MTGALHQIARQPVRFGPADRQMVGMYHFPRPAAPQGITALLCSPFGQEAIRAHRVFTVLADRLAQRGVPTLRFDYHGTGDSPGADDVGEMEGWAADVVAAQDKLDALARPAHRVWIGLRLGALLCAKASRAASATLDTIVFWDPVVDGGSYLRELARADREARLGALSLDAAKYRRLACEPLPAEPSEALGFPVTDSLRRQLRDTREQAFIEAHCARAVFAMPDAQEPAWLTGLRSARAGADATAVHRIDDGIDWATNDAGGTTIAPARTVGLIVPVVLEAIR
ncbi:MAG: hypothetical protein M9951_06310 [Burkholderiaceae bacterium]|jgi:alpha-beta hydrolase superfamily lysophospholipase|nr:hypothetical protein [Burkholderiaceae bacterium]